MNGQNIRIQGKITDKQTLESISFAHVIIEGTQTGAISDLHGEFILDIPERYRERRIEVSCLGYQTARISLEDLSQSSVKIILEQSTVQLKEVVVNPENPIELLNEAFRRIPHNYDTVATVMSGYYKMSSLLGDRNIKYTETFIDIFKNPYQAYRKGEKIKGDSIHLREVRTKRSEVEDWKLKAMLHWESDIYQLRFRDFVNDFSSKKNNYETFIKSYHFEIEKMVIINGRNTYKISVTPKKNKKKALWNGYIFLDEGSKAFVKLDVVSSKKLFKKLKADIGYIISSKLYNVNYDEGEWKESISYQIIDGKWRFKEVNSSKQFVISSKKRTIEKELVNVTLHYSTDSVKINSVLQDTTDFLNPRLQWWAKEKYISNKYKKYFWEAFDQQRNIVSDDVYLGQKDAIIHENKVYAYTKLDTLQGALTPIRTFYDVGFYHLDVEVFPKEEILKGSSLIRFRVIEPSDRMQIDLYSGMSVDSITFKGNLLNFEREFNAIYIDLPALLKKNSTEEIKVYFSGHPVDFNPEIPMYASFLWLEDLNGNPWIQAICQGYGASGWWPNKDHLSDEPDSAAISVTVPTGLDVISNGRLQQKVQLENNRTRSDWFISYPINNYNITLNIGKYEHFGDKYISVDDTLDLDYHMMPYNLKTARNKLTMVKPMLQTYEKYFGPYPFPKDGFKLLETPHAMEHQSCVALGYEYFNDSEDIGNELPEPDFENGSVDFQIVLHETAHEWWGNSVSCTDNAELWIHEAFATYAEALYIEEFYGYNNSQLYLNGMKNLVKNKTPIIGKFNVNHIHYNIDDMYYKGALILNTLRHVVNNDSLWFATLKGIQSTFKYQQVSTDDIVNYINQETGTDYTYFFDQYLRYPEIPKLELVFEKKEGKTYLNYRWVTNVNKFVMPLEYAIEKGNSKFFSPTNNWQKMELLNTEMERFKVISDRYYINIQLDNQ
ncbi:MAG: carboxypeptidase-like regulatory domain-containing protein [Flammeovirgaceae bacterium]|nr:carboxypeptidase-like regulatory domain-containing protein [Flammeovirgaceae bacterium]